MALVQMDERHRLTLPKDVRQKFRIVKGQKFYLIPSGNELIMKPIPKNPEKKLDEILGKFTFDRKARGRAERWLLKEAAAGKRQSQKKTSSSSL